MKHYCEDCKFMDMSEAEPLDLRIGFAQCTAVVNLAWEREARLTKDTSKIEASKYFYCTTERSKDTCENYKPKDLCDE